MKYSSVINHQSSMKTRELSVYLNSEFPSTPVGAAGGLLLPEEEEEWLA
jgi:hypothetical protein